MKIQAQEPPRAFSVGHSDHPISLYDCAHISLEPDEQITLIGSTGSQVDVLRKAWGYYAMSSLNGRLVSHGLHAALVRSSADGKYFILLVEKDSRQAFFDYLTETHQQLVSWLDSTEQIQKLTGVPGQLACLFCGQHNWELAFEYHSPPEGENRFDELFKDYHRAFYRCQGCRHYQARHDLDLSQIYTGSYGDGLYAGDRLHKTFERINALPPERSDNLGRLAYVQSLAARHFGADFCPSLLDVGCGLGVFPFRVAELGWPTWGLDPDPRAVEHLQNSSRAKGLCGDFMTLEATQVFDLISFNKVLEHVEDPIAMLARAQKWLKASGAVYIELPDGEGAAAEGAGREEFFLEHYHAFSAASFSLLIQNAGFCLESFERLREPSGKFTLRGYATPLLHKLNS